jgi:(2Fe-2S) ferredoxin
MICVRGQCAESGLGKQLEQQLTFLIEQHGLDNPDHPQHVTCRITNCLGVCANGPIMIIHPEAVKYQQVDRAALERIFYNHILNGQPVEELRVKFPVSRPIAKKNNKAGNGFQKKHKKKRWF